MVTQLWHSNHKILVSACSRCINIFLLPLVMAPISPHEAGAVQYTCYQLHEASLWTIKVNWLFNSSVNLMLYVSNRTSVILPSPPIHEFLTWSHWCFISQKRLIKYNNKRYSKCMPIPCPAIYNGVPADISQVLFLYMVALLIMQNCIASWTNWYQY